MGRPASCNTCCDSHDDCEFTDDFSSSQSGYTSYTHSGSPAPAFTVSGGKLEQTDDTASGSYYRTVRINQAGLKTISVQAKVYKPAATTGIVGVFIGGVRAFVRRGATNDSAVYTASSVGELSSPSVPGLATASGDVLKIQLQETSAGIFQILYLINGTLLHSESNVSLTLTSVFNVGVVGTLADCSWDNLVIACDNMDQCSLCESAPVVWKLNNPTVVHNAICNRCESEYNQDCFLYYNCSRASDGLCFWVSADKSTCRSEPKPKWVLIMPPASFPTIPVNLISHISPRPTGPCSSTLSQSPLPCMNWAHYTCPQASFNCLGSNTMVFSFADAPQCCTNWPTTITIEPA